MQKKYFVCQYIGDLSVYKFVSVYSIVLEIIATQYEYANTLIANELEKSSILYQKNREKNVKS